eukprot:553895-Amphidinium_carterae.1
MGLRIEDPSPGPSAQKAVAWLGKHQQSLKDCTPKRHRPPESAAQAVAKDSPTQDAEGYAGIDNPQRPRGKNSRRRRG